MHGDLSTTSLTDVCRRLAVGAASGELTVTGVGAGGWISFLDGAIVAAGSPAPPARLGDRLVGAGELGAAELAEAVRRQPDTRPPARLGALLVRAGLVTADLVRLVVQEQVLDALFELSRWRFGSYQFRTGVPARVAEVPVALPVDDALLDIARRRREWAELSIAIPDLAAVPVLQGDPGTTSVGLTGDEFTVLASVDGRQSVRELAAGLGYGEFELARIVHGLVLVGLVAIELPQDEVGAALDDALGYLDQLADAAGHRLAAPADDEPIGLGAQAAAAAPQTAARPEPEPAAVPTAEPDAAAPTELEPAEVAPTESEPAELAPTEPEPAAAAEAEPGAAAPAAVAPGEAAPDGPATPATGEVVEAELPSSDFRSALAELHGLDDEPAASTPAPQRATGGPAAADTDPDVDADPAVPGSDDFFPTRKPDRSPEDADEVAEFLRELSRLALEDDPPGAAEGNARPTPPRPTPARATPDVRPRRRGLFGRS